MTNGHVPAMYHELCLKLGMREEIQIKSKAHKPGEAESWECVTSGREGSGEHHLHV